MRILFTGASSFTGLWFVKELVAAGHEVVATFRQPREAYDGVRQMRVETVAGLGRPVFYCSFGSAEFLRLVELESSWDLLCHHAAEVTNYKSPEFDVVGALRNNCLNVRNVLAALVSKGCGKVLLTGSVFESGEGAGSDGVPAFSPYGLSKELTARVFQYYARTEKMRLGKFVIPNPFGPYEEPRFIHYLMRLWHDGKTPEVKTPAYIRDNIHVSLLARVYADFARTLPATPGFEKLSPSGYVESQGDFARRVAWNMQSRIGLPCNLKLLRQTEFTEPQIRINTDPINPDRFGWDEDQAWDEVADYYQRLFLGGID